MKNVTLSADEDLIDKARAIARSRRSTLNADFREWLQHYTAAETSPRDFEDFMKNLRHVNAGGSLSRDELNER